MALYNPYQAPVSMPVAQLGTPAQAQQPAGVSRQQLYRYFPQAAAQAAAAGASAGRSSSTAAAEAYARHRAELAAAGTAGAQPTGMKPANSDGYYDPETGAWTPYGPGNARPAGMPNPNPPTPGTGAGGTGTGTPAALAGGSGNAFEGDFIFDETGFHYDPRQFMFGRDPNYIGAATERNRTIAEQGFNDLRSIGNNALGFASAQGQRLADAGVGLGQGLADRGYALDQYGLNARDVGAQLAGRTAPGTNFDPSRAQLGYASGNAQQLAGLEAVQGPSAAQAALQQGLNASQANAISLARSGHGYGQNAQAMAEAQRMNSTMGTNAALAAAQLRAQEDAAYRQRQAANFGAASQLQQGIGGQLGQQAQFATDAELRQRAANDAAMQNMYGLGLQGLTTGANAYAQGGALAMQGLTNQGALGLQGSTLQGQLAQAAINARFSGEAAANQLWQEQAQQDLNRANLTLQQYAIRSGEAASNATMVNNVIGAGIGAVGAIGGAAVGSLVAPGAGTIAGGVLGAAAGQAAYDASNSAGGGYYSSDRRQKYVYGRVSSDEARKTGRHELGADGAPDFRGAPTYLYRYINPHAPGAAPGLQAGGMAQDLEHLPGVVNQTPHGQMVDTGRLALAEVGAVGDLQKRVDALEGKPRYRYGQRGRAA